MVTELCTGGEVYDEIMRLMDLGKLFSEKNAAIIIKQILESINYIHKIGIVH